MAISKLVNKLQSKASYTASFHSFRSAPASWIVSAGLAGTTTIAPPFLISTRAISRPAASTALAARVKSVFLKKDGALRRLQLIQLRDLRIKRHFEITFNTFKLPKNLAISGKPEKVLSLKYMNQLFDF